MLLRLTVFWEDVQRGAGLVHPPRNKYNTLTPMPCKPPRQRSATHELCGLALSRRSRVGELLGMVAGSCIQVERSPSGLHNFPEAETTSIRTRPRSRGCLQSYTTCNTSQEDAHRRVQPTFTHFAVAGRIMQKLLACQGEGVSQAVLHI